MDNLFYTDTDSLFVNQAGYDNLMKYIDPNEIGLLNMKDKTDFLNILVRKNF